MPQTKTPKLSKPMREVMVKMRQKKPRHSLFWNYAYKGAYIDEEPVNNKTFDALFERGLITMVVNVAPFARYELTELGKSIAL